ncbi:helicase HerA domain-containing protein [Pseudahrensia aquimaris]|uniref:Helicase HerA domain-containing protein n=1 Tax=Pseudahrensia aquimaris TaxID=744461 RepID=A0ABW3FCJ3_9HYPH
MNKDALMRRIAAATEAQQRAATEQAPKSAASRPQPQRLPPAPGGASQQSHMARVLMGEQSLPREAPMQPQPQAAPIEATPQAPAPATQSPAAPAPHSQMIPAAPAAAPQQPNPVHEQQAMAMSALSEQVPAAPQSVSQPVTQPVSVPQAATEPDPVAVATHVTPPNEADLIAIGVLVTCDGVEAVVETRPEDDSSAVTVGQMITLAVENNKVVGLVHRLSEFRNSEGESRLRVEVELQGEVRLQPDGSRKFHKGISSYPPIGTVAKSIFAAELASLYAASGRLSVTVGHLAQEHTIPAHIDIEAMLSKHFAVLGSTGCGKSSAVSLLLRKCVTSVPDLRTVILDPHNEYATAFPEATTIDQDNLSLPFWMFQLEEFAEVLFRGKPVEEEEVSVLREIIPEAKQRFREGEERLSLRSDSASMLTADTPLPYRISDLLAIIDEEIGLLEARFQRLVLKSLKSRVVAQSNDPRYRFMFRDKTITDRAEEVIDSFFNIHNRRHNLTILMMAGLPSEVVNVLASVLCRLSFELCIAGQGMMKSLMVCEEAHRYIPEGKSGFEPSRRAIARIAKEGRKYGSFIAIISQRPAELDATILSQCSTVFSLRLSNEQDQMLMRKAISNASRSTISFLSSLANREAIAFGEGLLTPMRLRFETLPEHQLPGKDRDVFSDHHSESTPISHVFRQWRGIAGVSASLTPRQTG